eukprot:TRINITY_DN3332_c0_g1_i1.p1 TRINITY_DN3332_c0_g1~~TRINITY_DN3332_c0_g1_i1.p1  ORF type:complete len:102 (-),score=6.38 TRINITY_DN3332_c0_g1_i1:299-604(-)
MIVASLSSPYLHHHSDNRTNFLSLNFPMLSPPFAMCLILFPNLFCISRPVFSTFHQLISQHSRFQRVQYAVIRNQELCEKKSINCIVFVPSIEPTIISIAV